MPNSTTLESLTIEINGSSQKASEGIGNLISSLRSLSGAVNNSLPGLRTLKTELRAISQINTNGISRILNPTANAQRGLKQTASTVKAIENSAKALMKPQSRPNLNKGYNTVYNPLTGMFDKRETAPSASAVTSAAKKSYDPNNDPIGLIGQIHKLNPKAKLSEIPGALENIGNKEAYLKSLRDYLASLQQGANEASNALNNTGKATNEAGEAAERAEPRFQRFFGVMSRIGRIASTMLIRTALKSLVKAFSESWNAAYEFSSAMGGNFAKSVDAARAMIADTATTVIQTFSPVFQALVPVINVVAGAIQYLCQAIQNLLSLLGATSDLFGATVSKINKGIGSSSGGKGKKNSKSSKNLLADWDELNVIRSQDNGITSGATGGSGSSYKPGSMASFINDEIQAILSVIVGEALLAIGLVLCFTGHIPAGIGLMVIGAAAIAKPLTTDWNKIPNETKRTIAAVTTIATGAFLALGLILLCTGHIPLGIGMLTIGAANFMMSMSVAWGAEAESGVRETVAKIMAIGGAGLMAIGLILACCGAIGIGVSMMVAGAAMWYSAYSLDSNAVLELVSGVLKQVGDWFQKTFNDIKIASKMAWMVVSDWWNKNIGDPIKKKWDSVVTFFSTLFGDSNTQGSIAYYSTIAWNALTNWWNSDIATPLSATWSVFTEFFSDMFDPEISGSIADMATEAWRGVSDWWNSSIAKPVEGAWNGFTNFFKGLWGNADEGTGIAGMAKRSWDWISKWWDTNVTANIEAEGAWGGVKGYFEGIIGDGETGISGLFSGLWSDMCKIWNSDVIENVKLAWKGVATWFETNITKPISDFFTNCVNGIIDAINWIIGGINMLNFTIPPQDVFGLKTPEISFGVGYIAPIEHIGQKADGDYGIPKGDLFIANEKGAELVGSMNGKTTVANQGQIIEGIQRGVSDANEEQNNLLRQQNDLLRVLIEKSGTLNINPSAGWGEFNQRSNSMWNMATGR